MIDKKSLDAEVVSATNSPNMGSKDRKMIAGSLFEIVKNYRFIQYLTEKSGGNINDTHHLVETYCCLHQIIYPDDPANYQPNPEDVLTLAQNPKIPKEVRYSIPDWLHHHLIKNGIFDWPEVMETLSGIAPLFLRTNTLKCTDTILSRHLSSLGMEFKIISPHCFQLSKHYNLSRDPLFMQGMFEIQDSGSQQISIFTSPTPGSMVIDACAGAGGKSLHLAALMQNKGCVLALDIHPKPLVSLRVRTEKAGAKIIQSHLYKEIKLADYQGLADQVLCDVPCSATGVLRRQIDQKWRLQPTDLHSLIHIQQAILEQSWQLLKSGGEMIYATCSIIPDENQLQISEFLSHHADAHLMESCFLLPQINGNDGFYMAKMQKK